MQWDGGMITLCFLNTFLDTCWEDDFGVPIQPMVNVSILVICFVPVCFKRFTLYTFRDMLN